MRGLLERKPEVFRYYPDLVPIGEKFNTLVVPGGHYLSDRSGARVRPAFALHQLIEVAGISAGGDVLHQEGEIVGIELLEPVIPRDLLQVFLAAEAWEFQPEHAGISLAAGAFHTGWDGAVPLGPLADFVVPGQGMRRVLRRSRPVLVPAAALSLALGRLRVGVRVGRRPLEQF